MTRAFPTRKTRRVATPMSTRWRRCGTTLPRPSGSKLLRSKSVQQIWLPSADAGAGSPRRNRARRGRDAASIFALNTARDYGRIELDVTLARRRAFRARRGQHRRRRVDARNRHHRAPCRARRDLRQMVRSGARRQGDRHPISARSRSRATRSRPTRAVGQGDAARPRRDRQLPSPSSKSTPTTSSARTARRSASSTRRTVLRRRARARPGRGARAAARGLHRRACGSDVDGDDRAASPTLARAALRAIA